MIHRPATQVRTVVRLAYENGQYHEQAYPIADQYYQSGSADRVLTHPYIDRVLDKRENLLPEASFNGLKFRRLGQFHFIRPDSATLIYAAGDGVCGKSRFDWFRSRVERLKRKGIMTEAPEEKKVELSVVHQSCKLCCFAEYQRGEKVPTQTGCSLGRLEKYREQGTETVQAYDEEAEFEIVNGRRCPAYRDVRGEWAKKTHPDNRAAAVRKELTIRTDVVVVLSESDNEGDPSGANPPLLLKLGATVQSLQKLALSPSSVHVLNNQSAVRVSQIIQFLRGAATGLNWSVTDIVERTAAGGRVPTERAIDLSAGKLKGHFYSVWKPGAVVPPTLTLDLDRAVNDDYARFSVLRPNAEGDGLTVALGFHKAPMVNGNKAVVAEVDNGPIFENGQLAIFDEPARDYKPKLLSGVVEKAEFIAAAHMMPHLVANLEDVCKTTSK